MEARPGVSTSGRRDENEERWRAVLDRDASADGAFVYSVRTTGVYCRPSCPSRRARRENVAFHATPAEAQRAGFRACRRCRPDLPSAPRDHAAAVIRACRMIEHADTPPTLNELAAAAGLSLFHFHRVFRRETGLTPHAYAAAHRSQRVRGELKRRATITAAIQHSGFSTTARFYDQARETLGMSPRTYRAGAPGVIIRYAVGPSTLGLILVAATDRGVCAIFLDDDAAKLVAELHRRFPRAAIEEGGAEFRDLVARVVAFVERPSVGLDLPIDIQGTAFQQRVWQALRAIPLGETSSYARIADAIGHPRATRAVAQACAANPLALVIPCHRVVRSNGQLSGYRWGVERKEILLNREAPPDQE